MSTSASDALEADSIRHLDRLAGGLNRGLPLEVTNFADISLPRVCEQAPNQHSKFLVRQRCKLQQTGVQPLELAFRHRVEVDAPNALVDTRPLQPTKENLGSTRIRDCVFP
jgi:hypothetical protein